MVLSTHRLYHKLSPLSRSAKPTVTCRAKPGVTRDAFEGYRYTILGKQDSAVGRRGLHRILIKDGETVSSAWILLGNTSATTYILIAVVAGIVVIGTVIAGLLTKKKK